MRLSITAVVASLLAQACTGARERAAVAPPLVVTGDSIGPVSVGTTRAQLGRATPVARDTVELGSEAIPESVAVLVLRGDTVRAVIDSGRVYRLTTAAAKLRTLDSIGVGTPLRRLLQIPGVYAITGEGAVYVTDPRHCGVSFLLGESGELADGPDSVGVERLRTLPDTTRVVEINIFGCRHR